MSGTSETFWRLSSLDPLVCPQGTGPWTLCSSACLRLIWTWTTWTWTETGTLPIRPSAQLDSVLTYGLTGCCHGNQQECVFPVFAPLIKF